MDGAPTAQEVQQVRVRPMHTAHALVHHRKMPDAPAVSTPLSHALRPSRQTTERCRDHSLGAGSQAACITLGKWYIEGTPVQGGPDIPADPTRAARVFSHACQQVRQPASLPATPCPPAAIAARALVPTGRKRMTCSRLLRRASARPARGWAGCAWAAPGSRRTSSALACCCTKDASCETATLARR
jgi:hypothetical protein